jgi:hypothetical protein
MSRKKFGADSAGFDAESLDGDDAESLDGDDAESLDGGVVCADATPVVVTSASSRPSAAGRDRSKNPPGEVGACGRRDGWLPTLDGSGRGSLGIGARRKVEHRMLSVKKTLQNLQNNHQKDAFIRRKVPNRRQSRAVCA